MRIGPETVTDPAFLVTRSMEDFVTWVDTSKIKRKVQKFNEVRPSSSAGCSDCTFGPCMPIKFNWLRTWCDL